MYYEYEINKIDLCNSDELNVEDLVNDFTELWYETSESFPVLSKIYNRSQKRRNETTIEKFVQSLQNENKDQGTINYRESKYSDSVKSFLRQNLLFDDEHIEFLFSNNFMKVTQEFIKSAREFDSQISSVEIFQACRNVWAMNWIQLMLGIKIELTPSIFAYSMLYPYTDNIIDSPDLTYEYKVGFNERVLYKVIGKDVQPSDTNEKKIFDLIEMIELQFPREKYPGVFFSLEAIQLAQMKSLKLVQSCDVMKDDELLRVSVEKGGTSVLADGFLVAGSLNEDQRHFLFGYGAYLQLVDDLQDVNEDYSSGVKTLFSKFAEKKGIYLVANRTYNFGMEIISRCFLTAIENKEQQVMKELMDEANRLLIVDAVGMNSQFYGFKYVHQIQKYSPFRFAFLRKKQTSLLTSFLTL